MMKYNSRVFRLTAKTLFAVLALELVSPAMRTYALTSGPSQPEVQSFEPVGTTDMVDLFSGDFVYNIPLLDVEGYPVNIAYHSGSNVESEASWVGLGWNINPGAINRSVRGIPDDFSGEQIEKQLHVKDETTVGLKLGADVELFGLEFLRGGIGNSITYNNYKGMGVGFDASLNLKTNYVTTGLGLTVGSQEGATLDANLSTNASDGAGVSGSVQGSTGFNTRSGLRDLSYGISTNQFPLTFNSYIPIGLRNYVSTITNATHARGISFSTGLGMEVLGTFPHFRTEVSGSVTHHEEDGSMPAYGYLYLEKSGERSITDFSREKDGIYNKSLPNLPLSSLTYDLYSISGQGTGGMFRPFRNDIGTVSDPKLDSDNDNFSSNVEAGFGTGFGGLFEIGTNVNMLFYSMKTGAWKKRPFLASQTGSLFENVFFKQAGELTRSVGSGEAITSGKEPLRVDSSMNMFNKQRAAIGLLPRFIGQHEDRNPRANNMSVFTNKEATTPGVAIHQKIENYPRNQFTGNPQVEKVDRLKSNTKQIDAAKPNHIGEISQILPDGRRYIYAIGARNNVQREVTFSTGYKEINDSSYIRGLVSNYTDQENSYANRSGRDHYYQSTTTPSYVHSYLLTDVLSADYVDITGDGPTEDDHGTYTKINYSRTSKDYKWRTPYERPGEKRAQFSPGYYSDKGDDKANYIVGSKEMWYIHSIESKNYIAEFYTSPRKDGMGYKGSLGVDNVSGDIGSDTSQRLYRLDSIKLFSKRDRFINGANATAIKTVVLVYEENAANQLCPGIPNYTGANSGIGKLTLKRIYFKFGNSNRSLLNPYEFNYSAFNPSYNFMAKDRWGNYKPAVGGLSNYEFPYVTQNKAAADSSAMAWQLTEVKLPSGGSINVQYESDDYSYVQDKRAMEMFKVSGVGADKNFIAKSELYEGEGENIINNYIYFKRDTAREIRGRSLKENYLPEDDLLYFNFFVDIGNKNAYEPIKAYGKVEEIGKCTNDSLYGYVKLKQEKAGKSTDRLMNPVTLAGLNIGRFYLPHIIYPGYTDGELSLKQTIQGMVGATEELFTIAQNPNIRFMKRGLAKAIDLTRCYIRVGTPGMSKLGGGCRVKRLTFSDGWNQMTAGGQVSVMGKDYSYTMTDATTGKKISSGVANYEPMIGADENPCRKPVYYSGDGGKLLPAVQLFQEEPLGESFYPGGSVGYSKVTVSSIHKQEGAASKGVDEYEFYTAKDFPNYIDKTVINTDEQYRRGGFVQQKEILSLSQGYSLVLNDMHGKSKAISNYVARKGGEQELISSVKYNYQLNAQGKLDNTVSAVGRNNDPFNPQYEIANTTLGQEVDLTVDSRQRVNSSLSIPVNFNLNVLFFAPFVVVPVPTVFTPVKQDINTFRTHTVTKVVQQYGILKSTEVTDHGAKTLTENLVYNAENGQVVVSKTNNEFNDPLTKIDYPASWMHPNMGGAYANQGYSSRAGLLYVDSALDGYIKNIQDFNLFTEGDELLVTDDKGAQYILWVEGKTACPVIDTSGSGSGGGTGGGTGGGGASITTMVPIKDNLFGTISWGSSTQSTGCCALKVTPRAKYPNGDGISWRTPKTILENITIKIIRSGRKNQLGSPMLSLSLSGSYVPTSFADLFSNSTLQGKVLATQATRYGNNAEEDQIEGTLWGANYGFNAFVRGLKGAYRPTEQYGLLGSRDYNNDHARKNGTLASFTQPWKNPNTIVPGSCQDLASKYSSGWQADSTWLLASKITKYGSNGLSLEEQDASGVYSTALYSYGGNLPVAVAQNARYKQVRYFSFDDMFSLNSGNHWMMLKFTGSSTPISYSQLTNTYYNREFGISPVSTLGSGLAMQTEGHSGLYSLQLNGGALKIGAGADFGFGNSYYVSAWVKSNIAPTNTSLYIVGTTGGSTNSYYPFTTISKPIEGWYKMEGVITIPTHTTLSVAGVGGIILDDLRICPDKANMKSFVYDVLTSRLMAQLDENNFATFYEYDAEGKLVRTKKETNKGILTLSESRMSAAK